MGQLYNRLHMYNTYEREGVSHTSTLDHFYLSERTLPKVSDAGVFHHPDNSSDQNLFTVYLNPSMSPRTQIRPLLTNQELPGGWQVARRKITTRSGWI